MRRVCVLALPLVLLGGLAIWAGPAVIRYMPYVGDPREPVLFIIEENHASRRVQAEIRDTILALGEVGIKTVLVEGMPFAEEPLDFEIFKELLSPTALSAVTIGLGHLLTGVETAAFEVDLAVYGIEDFNLWKKHFELLLARRQEEGLEEEHGLAAHEVQRP